MPQQPTITIISGPQGCGKTRCLDVLREMYPCDGVLDSWDGSILHLMQATSFAARSHRHGPATPTSLSGYRLLVLTHLPIESIMSRKLMSRIAAEGFVTTIVDFVKIQDEVFRRFNAVGEPTKKSHLSRNHKITLVCVHSSAGDDLLTPERTSTIYRLALSEKLPILTDLDPADPASINMLKMVSPMFGNVYAFVHGREQAASQLAAQLAHSDLDVGIVTLR